MTKPIKQFETVEDCFEASTVIPFKNINGDPGVGGLLADPEENVEKKQVFLDIPNQKASPDPAPPQHHGDWAPNKVDQADK